MEKLTPSAFEPPPATQREHPLTYWRIKNGLSRADPEFDALTVKELREIAVSGKVDPRKCPSAVAPPPWIAQHEMERARLRAMDGTEMFKRNLHLLHFGLLAALCQGFRVTRFSEVLVYSGYSTTVQATWNRFRNTSMHIFDWFADDLLDPEGVSRSSLNVVRAMHSMARKYSEKICDIGKPLSQYDMSLVMLAFTSVSMDIIKKEFNREIDIKQQEDYLFRWRIIGHYLGIEEGYNICTDGLEGVMETNREFIDLVPYMTPNATSMEMADHVVQAFGTIGGMGTEFLWSFVAFESNLVGYSDPTWLLPQSRRTTNFVCDVLTRLGKFCICHFISAERHDTIGLRFFKITNTLMKLVRDPEKKEDLEKFELRSCQRSEWLDWWLRFLNGPFASLGFGRPAVRYEH
eukprot:Clim_evm114s210 gene=Clim_evmTU114s210